MAETIEARLVALGESLEFARVDTLPDDVLDVLAAPAGRRWRRAALAAAALVLLATTAVLAVPGSRRTVARWLGFDELRIERVEVVPPTVTLPPGEPTTIQGLAAAAARVGVEPLVAPELGTPISVETPLDRYLVVRYEDAQLVVLPGTVETDLFRKFGTAVIRPVELFDSEAYWITGDPHVLMYVDAEGEVREARPAEDTLVWQRGDDLVRIEGDVSLERAIEIAESVRPDP